MNNSLINDAILEKGELLRYQSLKKKRALEESLKNLEAERKGKIYELEEMHRQIKTFKVNQRSNYSRTSNFTNQNVYLERIRMIHEKAKELIASDPYDLCLPATKLLNEENLKSVPKASLELKIPVLVPQSMIRKSKKLEPPFIQKTLKSGEVVNVYLTAEKTPVYDPMVNAEMSLNKEELKKVEDLRAQIRIKEEKRWRYISPKRKREEDLDLAKPESVNLRVVTPVMKFERHNCRDYVYSELSQTPSRFWVGQTMKVYSNIIKTNIKPKISEKKQIEIMMRNEKTKIHKFGNSGRVKIIS